MVALYRMDVVLIQQLYFNLHFAEAVCEFKRVRDKVDEHLAQPTFISVDPAQSLSMLLRNTDLRDYHFLPSHELESAHRLLSYFLKTEEVVGEGEGVVL